MPSNRVKIVKLSKTELTNQNNSNTAKISTLEKFKGEIDGEFTSLWVVATDVNKNRFMA